jgi:HEAT repeat protein
VDPPTAKQPPPAKPTSHTESPGLDAVRNKESSSNAAPSTESESAQAEKVSQTGETDVVPTAPEATKTSISVKCPKCSRSIKAALHLAGQTVRCPKCAERVSIPVPDLQDRRSASTGVPAESHERIDLHELIATAINEPAPPLPADRQFGSVLGARKLRKLAATVAAGRATDAGPRAVEAASAAINELCESRDAKAVETLAAEFVELPLGLKSHALKQLGVLGDSAALPMVLPLLASPEEPLLRGAILCLGTLGDRRAVKPLLGAATSTPQHRVRAIDAVVRIGDSAVPVLLGLLDSEVDLGIKHAALEVLGRTKHAKAIPAIASFLRHSAVTLRRLAAELLSQFDDLRAMSQLAAVFDDSDEQLRLAAVRGAARTPDPGFAQRLMPRLNDESREVRLAAIQALGACGDKRSLDGLRPHLQSDDDEFVDAAAEALSRLGDAESVEQLTDRLQAVGGDPEQQPIALRLIDSLRRIGDPRAAVALVDLLSSPSPRIRARIAEALGHLQDPALRPALEDLLRSDPMDEVRASAARALATIGDAQATRTLVDVGLADVPAVRVQSLIALGSYVQQLQLDDLSHLAADPNPQARYQVATLLGEIGNREAIPVLTPLAFDSEEMVQRAARKSLQTLGDTRTEKQLRKAFGKRPPTPSNSAASLSTVAPRRNTKRRFTALSLVPNVVLGAVLVPMDWLRSLRAPNLESVDSLPGGKGSIIAAGLTIAGAVFFFVQPSGGIVTHSSAPPRGNVATLATAQNGQFIVAGRTMRMIEIWNAGDKQLVERIVNTPSQWLACSPDGSTVLSADATSVSRIRLTPTGQVDSQEPLSNLNGSLQLFAASDDGRFAAAVNSNRELLRWPLNAGPPVRVPLPPLGANVRPTALALSPDGQLAAVAGSDGHLAVWNCETSQLIDETSMIKLTISALTFSADGHQLAAAAGDQGSQLCLWRTDNLQTRPEIVKTTVRKTDRLQFRVDGRLIGTSGNRADIWDLATGQSTPLTTAVTIDAIALLSDDRMAIGDDEERPILIYDQKGTEPVQLDEAPST